MNKRDNFSWEYEKVFIPENKELFDVIQEKAKFGWELQPGLGPVKPENQPSGKQLLQDSSNTAGYVNPYYHYPAPEAKPYYIFRKKRYNVI